jgi:hypothetical protein
MNYYVYIHIFPNDKVYIGITQQKPLKRWNGGYGYKNQKIIYNAILKYGWNNIKHKILYENLTKEEAEQKEIELITKHNSTNRKYGYNISNGGNCKGALNEITKKKISIANKGKKRTEEQKEYIRRRCIETRGKPVLYHEYKFIIKENCFVECVKITKYNSINEAARETRRSVSMILTHCNKKKNYREDETYFKYI